MSCEPKTSSQSEHCWQGDDHPIHCGKVQPFVTSSSHVTQRILFWPLVVKYISINVGSQFNLSDNKMNEKRELQTVSIFFSFPHNNLFRTHHTKGSLSFACPLVVGHPPPCTPKPWAPECSQLNMLGVSGWLLQLSSACFLFATSHNHLEKCDTSFRFQPSVFLNVTNLKLALIPPTHPPTVCLINHCRAAWSFCLRLQPDLLLTNPRIAQGHWKNIRVRCFASYSENLFVCLLFFPLKSKCWQQTSNELYTGETHFVYSPW